MKIAICNTPLRNRESATIYPPLGVLAVMQSLRTAGYNADFYDINLFRPSDKKIEEYFSAHTYDIVGISATVSTSYRFVKKIASIVRAVSPEAVIIVGGALTVSSEIILKCNHIDFCVIGEGERSIVHLVNYIAAHGSVKNDTELQKIKGVCFLGSDGEAVFTGYERQLAVHEIQDPDYAIIEKYSRIDQYFPEHSVYEQFKHDRRSFEKKRLHKKTATVITSRGCVNRCAFCYRWQSGIRIFPVERVIRNIIELMQKYNVGFISFGDEDFGATKKWLGEFIEKIRPLNILYRISGVCCDNVDLDILKRLKETGCVALHYGFESGSNRMLTVMEKRSDTELNAKIAALTNEAELQTVPALVIGLPGESYGTINETIDFVKRITESLPREPIISANALVALPGTPVYEYARYRGFLGNGLKDEEEYLLRISDQGGTSMKQLNLTDYPYFIVQGWIRCISIATRYNYHKKNNRPSISTFALIRTLLEVALKRRRRRDVSSELLYGHPLFYHLRHIISPLLVMFKNYEEDKTLFSQRMRELLTYPFRKRVFNDYMPLRKFLSDRSDDYKNIKNDSIQVLRLGR